ncbi:hypothetical protein B0H13DRAFT_1882515 [Mycena leptocephala]|nr:hypothetical protein B0H13DRAFT_1882515 [Mycena leptocephala]
MVRHFERELIWDFEIIPNLAWARLISSLTLLSPSSSSLFMPAGRRRLDPQTKQDHVLQSRKRYEEKNAEKRCEDTRLRMQREPPSQPGTSIPRYKYREKAAEASERYRARKREEERAQVRAANVVKRRACSLLTKPPGKIEANNLRRKHAPVTQVQHKQDQLAAATPTPAPVARKARCLSLPLQEEHRISDIAAEDDDSTDSEHDIARAKCLPPEPIFELRVKSAMSKCSRCYEEGCPGYKTLNFCLPIYAPDPGHEDKSVHDASPWAFFYVIVSKEWGGVVTSRETLDRKLDQYPDARTFAASTWKAIIDLWNEDCECNHGHKSDTPESSPAASACACTKGDRAPSPTKIKACRTPSPTKGRSTSPPQAPSAAGGSGLPPVANPLQTGHAGRAGIRFPHPIFHKAAHNRDCQAEVRAARELEDTAAIAAKFEAWSLARGIKEHEGSKSVLLYGVSGHNRVFQDWDRAMAALKETPGAELVFAHDEEAVHEFVRVETARMLKKFNA